MIEPAFLDGLDDIDWSTYAHAYGTAEAVPGLMRAWLSRDSRRPASVSDHPDLLFAGPTEETVSQQALADLWASVFHQGDLHSAAGPMAPYLLRVVRKGDPTERGDALDMLTQTISPLREIWEADGFDPRIHEDPVAYAAAAETATYLSLLDPEAPREIQAKTAAILGWMPQDAALIADELRRRLRDSDRQDLTLDARLTLTLAMADRHVGDQTDLERFEGFRRQRHPASIAGALALARMRAVEVPGPAFRQLRDALEEPSPFEETSYGYPDPLTEDRFTRLIADALVNAVLHSPSGDPGDHLRSAVLSEVEQAFGEYGRHDLLSLLAFHRVAPSDTPSVRRLGQTPSDPGRDSADRFHALAPSARIQRASWSTVSTGLVGLLGFGGQRIRLVSLESLDVVGTLVTQDNPDAPAVQGKIDTTQVDELQASIGGALQQRGPALLSVAASPDGRWVAADSAGLCLIWDLQGAEELREPRRPVAVLSGFLPTRVEFAWSPDSSELATAAVNQLHVWRTGSWSTPDRIVNTGDLSSLGWSIETSHRLSTEIDQPAEFTDGDGTILVRLYSLEGADDSVLWTAPNHPSTTGPGFIHTNHPGTLLVYRWLEKERPLVIDGHERDHYLEAVDNPAVVRTRLRHRSWET